MANTNIVTCEILDGRTYVDILELIRAIDKFYDGDQISKSNLRERLYNIDSQAQSSRGNR